MKKNVNLIILLIALSLQGFAAYNATLTGYSSNICPDPGNTPTMFNEFQSGKDFDGSAGVVQDRIVYTCGGIGTIIESGTTEYTVRYVTTPGVQGSYVGREKFHVRFPTSGATWVQVTYYFTVFGVQYTATKSLDVLVGTPAYTPTFSVFPTGLCNTNVAGTFKATTTEAIPVGTTGGYSWSAGNGTVTNVTAHPSGTGSIATISYPANSSPVTVMLKYNATCPNVGSPNTTKSLLRNQTFPTDAGITFNVTASATTNPAKKNVTCTISSCYWSITKSSLGSNGQYQVVYNNQWPETSPPTGLNYTILLINGDIISLGGHNANSCGSSAGVGVAYKLVNGQLQWMDIQRTTSIDEDQGLNFTVSPNPASSSIIITCGNMMEANYNLSIYDMLGKKVQETAKMSNDRATIDVSGLENGAYFLNVDNGNSIIKREKIIINH
jgi:hypothetical protein